MKRVTLIFFFLMAVLLANAQYKISGQITGTNNEPVAGCVIQLADTYAGTITDSDGKFAITNIKPGEYTIDILFVGYERITEKLNVVSDIVFNKTLTINEIVTDEIIVSATRANSKTPIAFTNFDKKSLEKNSAGQDVPYVLNMIPSLVASSDAGAGVGYTSLRIRGTDATRINVTINGIPLNDPESQGTYWVDVPDICSSVENIQVQRGAGTSTNGAGSFGGTINLQTTALQKNAYTHINSSAGSFNTFKNSINVGSGLINNRFTFDARVSQVKSDGFIDRAFTNMNSYYLSGAYYDGKNMFRFNTFGGKEDTYQAWNGVPKVRLENDLEGMKRYGEHGLISELQMNEMIASNNRTYNLYTYKNEIDHYDQTHYQALYSREITKNLHINTTVHYTKGAGYYEQYKNNKKLAEYNLNPVVVNKDTIRKSDLVQRKWLDNDFYGITYTLSYKQKTFDFIFGGAYNEYYGNHFGKVRWMRFASNSEIDHEWYRSKGIKKDFNSFAKFNFMITKQFNIYADLQIRNIHYKINGVDDYQDADGKQHDISQEHSFLFFNPKFGCYYHFYSNMDIYASVAVANREPSRSNFIDAPNGKTPKFETLYDYEIGYKLNQLNYSLNLNAFYMDYKNQLILTGQINNVGEAIMVNAPNSYRAGIEFIAGLKPFDNLSVAGNVTVSKNRIKNFTSYVDDWDNWGSQVSENLGETTISFSPSVIGGLNITWEIFNNLELDIMSKYVSRQYIDNTENKYRSIDPYWVNDAKISYTIKTKIINEIKLNFAVNNFLNEEYETNAWIYRYYTGNEYYTMDGYFPQAGINFMGGLQIKF